MSARRGGIPGPESRTGLVRPAMTEAEFERRQSRAPDPEPPPSGPAPAPTPTPTAESPPEPPEPAPRSGGGGGGAGGGGGSRSRSRSGSGAGSARASSKPRRVQRMFAIEEELDKKLWLYAIHVGKDRSEVVNDLLRPLVSSMVLYDSRDRRSSGSRSGDSDPDGPGAD